MLTGFAQLPSTKPRPNTGAGQLIRTRSPRRSEQLPDAVLLVGAVALFVVLLMIGYLLGQQPLH